MIPASSRSASSLVQGMPARRKVTRASSTGSFEGTIIRVPFRIHQTIPGLPSFGGVNRTPTRRASRLAAIIKVGVEYWSVIDLVPPDLSELPHSPALPAPFRFPRQAHRAPGFPSRAGRFAAVSADASDPALLAQAGDEALLLPGAPVALLSLSQPLGLPPAFRTESCGNGGIGPNLIGP